jgi:hypothetical protein
LPEVASHQEIIRGLEEVAQHPLNQGKYMSADHTTTVIIVQVQASARRGIRSLLAQIDGELKPLARTHGILLAVTGNPPMRMRVVDFLIRDQLVNNIVGFTIGFIVSLFLLRSLIGTIHNVLPAAVALFWVLGGMSLLGIAITAMTIVLPVLIMVLAFSDSMHMTFNWQKRVTEGQAGHEAAIQTIRTIGPACALTSVTTTIAFLSLTISDAPPIRELGISGALATMTAFASVIIINPLFCYWRSRHKSTLRPAPPLAQPVVSTARLISRLSVGYARPLTVISIVLTLVGGVLFYALERNYSFLENVPTHTEEFRALQLLEQQLGGYAAVQIEVSAVAGSYEDPSSWAALRRLTTQIAAEFPDAGVFSFATFADWLYPADIDATFVAVRDPLGELSAPLLGRWVSSDNRDAVITVFLRDQDAKRVRLQIDQLNGQLSAEQAAGTLLIAEPTGILAVSTYQAIDVINRLVTSLMIAVTVCIALIGMALRSVKLALISVVPNILPIILTGAALYFFDAGLQFTSAIALTVAFGIAVDNTIHFLNRFRLLRQTNDRPPVTIIRTLKAVGPVIVATTVTLSSGMAITLFGNLPTVALFGLLCVTIFVIALISDLIILPAMLITFFRRNHP